MRLILGIWTYTVGTLTNFEECSQCVHQVTEIGCKVTAILLLYSIMNVQGHRREPVYIMVLSIRCVTQDSGTALLN